MSYRLSWGSDTNYLWVLYYLHNAPDRAVVGNIEKIIKERLASVCWGLSRLLRYRSSMTRIAVFVVDETFHLALKSFKYNQIPVYNEMTERRKV